MKIAYLVQASLILQTISFSLTSASAATFDVVREDKHGSWSSVLYRNRNDGELFCALESTSKGTTFRLNRYRSNNDSFVEVYNSMWNMIKGKANFSLEFKRNLKPLVAELSGKSWGDSYTYDVLDEDTFNALGDLIATSETLVIENSNGDPLAEFKSDGAVEAVKAYIDCILPLPE